MPHPYPPRPYPPQPYPPNPYPQQAYPPRQYAPGPYQAPPYAPPPAPRRRNGFVRFCRFLLWMILWTVALGAAAVGSYLGVMYALG
ncbi:hypothetical protein [Fodinicola feengrottensis]|uniref:Uncharacterized protein n=1 Tax=Fodinicola feengrottensis TaxID=435914 RepID=A0ABN2GWM1_9ACTN|nr:hypothetical protein [Fodinicola feengrottensis]